MVKKIFCMYALLGYALQLTAYNWDRMNGEADVSSKYSNIALLTGVDGSRYLLKQRKGCGVHQQYMTVIEAFGTHVAQTIGLPANKVELIAAGEKCPFLSLNGCPATLHSFVPGVPIKEVPRYKKRQFSQGNEKKPRARGLARQHIKTMSMHPDLPPIMACDTFLGNKRNKSNLLYDAHTDKFYAIDFGATLRMPFAQSSLKQLPIALAQPKPLTHKELQGLYSYYLTLKKLIQLHSLESLMGKLRELTHQAGLSPSTFYCSDTKETYKKYVGERKKCLKQNYKATEQLVGWLDHFFAQNDIMAKLGS